MQVGDLVKPTLRHAYALARTDIGVVIDTESFRGYHQAAVRWSCGKVNYINYELLEVISANRQNN